MKFKIEGLQHIGIPTKKYKETLAFYNELGFKSVHKNIQPSGGKVCFLSKNTLMLEIYESDEAEINCAGPINHFALDSSDIDLSYMAAVENKMKIITKGIESLDFWEKGIKYFIIEGPNKERVEICQKL